MKKINWFVVLQILGLAILFGALQWNSFTMPMERDEGEYAYSAWLMREGRVPYRDSFLQKPPMIVYTYAVGQLLDENAVWPPRALGALFSLFTAVVIGLIARELYGKRAGWLAVWMYLPMCMLPIFLPQAANTEKFLLLPLVLTLLIRIRYGTKARGGHWLLAGVLAALAILYKQTAIVPFVVLFAFWTAETRKAGDSLQRILGKLSYAVVGAVATTAVVLAFFVFHGAIGNLIESTVTYNFYYAQVGGQRLQFFASMMIFLIEQWWILIPAFAWYVFAKPKRWLEVTILCLVSLVVASGDINGHYYLMVVPFLALIGVGGIEAFIEWLAAKFTRQPLVRPVVLLVSILVVIVLVVPLRATILLKPDSLSELIYWGNPFVESPIVAEHVRENSSPGDTLFVAGSEPQIQFLARRPSPTRFDIVYPLTLPTPVMQKYQEEVKHVLEKTPPAVVVFSLTQMSWFYEANQQTDFRNFVVRMLQSGQYSIVGGYMRNGGQKGWVEPLESKQVSLCTLIVLKRK